MVFHAFCDHQDLPRVSREVTVTANSQAYCRDRGNPRGWNLFSATCHCISSTVPEFLRLFRLFWHLGCALTVGPALWITKSVTGEERKALISRSGSAQIPNRVAFSGWRQLGGSLGQCRKAELLIWKTLSTFFHVVLPGSIAAGSSGLTLSSIWPECFDRSFLRNPTVHSR